MHYITKRTRELLEDMTVSDRPKDPLGLLRSKLCSLECERRFNGNPYPEPLVEFPWELTGRGFFPGGDGLWRKPILSSIRGPSMHPFPFDGIMYVGQDFGSRDKYPPKDKLWELDNVATWKFLVKRITISKTPGNRSFFTNALLGLRKEGSTVGQNDCLKDAEYVEMCRTFLSYQIEIQDPRLIVIFQSVNEKIYYPLLDDVQSINHKPSLKSATCIGRQRIILITPHPSSDHGIIKRNPQNYLSRCNSLSEAWQQAKDLYTLSSSAPDSLLNAETCSTISLL